MDQTGSGVLRGGRMVVTEGCNSSCVFCAVPNTLFGYRDTEAVLADIDRLVADSEVDRIDVIDQNFFTHPDVRTIAAHFANRKPWTVVIDAQRRHGEMARLNEAIPMGLKRVNLRLFTTDRKIQERIGRRYARINTLNTLTYLRAIKTKNRGCPVVVVTLLYGLPGQTRASVAKDLERITRFPWVHIRMYPLRVMPGSWLSKHHQQMHVVLDDNGVVKATRYLTAAEMQEIAMELVPEVMAVGIGGPDSEMKVLC